MRIKSLLLITSFLLTACNSKQELSQSPKPPVPVLASKPLVKDVPIYVEAIGTLLPSVHVEIRPQVNGLLTDVLVTEGQWIEKGTPLFKIDSTTYANKVTEAEAQLNMDRIALQASQKKRERFRSLAQKDLIAQVEWDEYETAAAQAAATLKLSEARLDAARIDLEHCTIISSIDGRIGKIDPHPGALVTANQSTPLATISKLDPLIVEFSLTEKELPKLKNENTAIEIHSLCTDSICNSGNITFLDNQFNKSTGQLLVRGKIENHQHLLLPGQSVRVRVPIALTVNATLIPQKAVKYNQNGPYIYVVQADNTVGIRQLILGAEQGSDVIVLQGVDSSEPVVTDGHLRLSPGLKVEIKS